MYQKNKAMKNKPTYKDVEKILSNLQKYLIKEECWSCDCLQGFLAQLELDSETDITHLITSFKVSKDEMHGCLGCDPCPPGEAFSAYIKKKIK